MSKPIRIKYCRIGALCQTSHKHWKKPKQLRVLSIMDGLHQRSISLFHLPWLLMVQKQKTLPFKAIVLSHKKIGDWPCQSPTLPLSSDIRKLKKKLLWLPKMLRIKLCQSGGQELCYLQSLEISVPSGQILKLYDYRHNESRLWGN